MAISTENLKKIKDLNYIPDGLLMDYLNGKDWVFVDSNGKITRLIEPAPNPT